jgi:hypothetical protein
MYECARHESLETSQSGVTDILVAGDPILCCDAFHDLARCLVLVGSRVQGMVGAVGKHVDARFGSGNALYLSLLDDTVDGIHGRVL